MFRAALLETGNDNAALEKRRCDVACIARNNSSRRRHFLTVHFKTGATYQEGRES